MTLRANYVILTRIPCSRYREMLRQGGSGWLVAHREPIAAQAGSAFSSFLLRHDGQNVRDDLLNAAEINGSGAFRDVAQIRLPLSRPRLIALDIFTVTY